MKYYRAKVDSFMWVAGAIIGSTGSGYQAIEEGLWDKVHLNTEYISDHIVENPGNADMFERVYPDTLAGKAYKTKDQVLASYEKAFK